MSVQEAKEALEQAEVAFKNARRGIAAAQIHLREEQTLEAAETLRKARESAEAHELLVGARREALEQAERSEAKQREANAAVELEHQLDEIHSERGRLSGVIETIVQLYGQLSNMVDVAAGLAKQDAVRLEAASETAKLAGADVDIEPLDLEVIRAAVALRLAESYAPAATPDDVLPTNSPLGRALTQFATVRTYADVARALAEVQGRLSAAVGSAPQDWLALAPRRSEPGTYAESLRSAALDLLERYAAPAPPGVP